MTPHDTLPTQADDAIDEARLLRDHYDESRMTAVVALPVATWRAVVAACRYVTEHVATAHRGHVTGLGTAQAAIRCAIEARVPNAQGQTQFSDEIADAPDLDDALKIQWLRICLREAEQRAVLVPRAGDCEHGVHLSLCRICGTGLEEVA